MYKFHSKQMRNNFSWIWKEKMKEHFLFVENKVKIVLEESTKNLRRV